MRQGENSAYTEYIHFHSCQGIEIYQRHYRIANMTFIKNFPFTILCFFLSNIFIEKLSYLLIKYLFINNLYPYFLFILFNVIFSRRVLFDYLLIIYCKLIYCFFGLSSLLNCMIYK
jgi:hypothetical protein